MSAAERGDLAERLVPIAAGLACLVHGEGDQRHIAQVIGQFDSVERDALIVVLAGLVDPDARVDASLAYLTWDEYGRAAAPTQLALTLRDIAVWPAPKGGLNAFFKDEQKVQARIKYHQLGQPQDDIARDLGVNERTIGRWVGAPREQVPA